MRQQLGETEKRASEIDTTATDCRAKLNEALSEQRELETRTAQQYQEVQQELQAEKEGRAANASTMEARIEASRKEHEELVNEIRANADRESLQSKYPRSSEGTLSNISPANETILQLRKTLEHQKMELDQSRASLGTLFDHLEDQAASNNASTIMQTQVEALLDKATKREVEDRNQREFNDFVSSRYDTLTPNWTS